MNSKKILYFALKNKVLLCLGLIYLIMFSSCGPRRPINLTVAKERVEDYYECGQFDKDLDKTIDQAIKHFSKISTCNNATVIFDIDETLLSGYCDEKSISFGYIPKLFHEWVLRADAPAIAQTKKLYNYIVDRGFKIILLTGRKYDEYEATMKNLKNEGFTHFEKLILRQKGQEKLTAQEYKTEHRKNLTQEGYRIIGNIGDQWSDLKGPYSGYTVKIQNYRYALP